MEKSSSTVVQEDDHSVHSVLNVAKKEIRLFELHAGNGDDFLTGTLHCTSIYKVRQYEALSWCWGPSEHDEAASVQTVMLHSGLIQIRSNLAVALRTLRRANTSRILWVDTICINQSQTTSARQEKEQQIQLMGEIFGSAEAVLVWLGPELHLISRALPVFRMLANPRISDREALLAIRKAQEEPWKLSDGSIRSEIGECTMVEFLVWISQFPFWMRLWVVQEVTLAKSVVIVCDHSYLQFKDLIRVYERICKLENEIFELDPNFYANTNIIEQSLGLFRDCRSQFGPGCRVRAHMESLSGKYDQLNECHDFRVFAILLTMCRGQFSTDPRDKIYGLLGLSSRTVRDSIKPEYGASISEILRNAAEVILRKTKSLFVLSQAVKRLSEAVPSDSNTPSWLPCWTAQANVIITYEQAKYRLRQETLFSACGPIEAEHVEFHDNYLKLHGIVIDLTLSASNYSRWQKGRYIGIPNLDFLQVWQSREESMPGEKSSRLLKGQIGDSSGRMPTYLGMQGEKLENVFWKTWAHDQEPTFDTDKFQRCQKDFPLRCEFWRQDYMLYVQAGRNIQAWSSRSVGFLGSKIWADTDIPLYYSCFFVSGDGFLGLARENILPGDHVCVLAGACLPVILRPLELGSYRFKLVCECFVLGLMDGEATRDARWSYFWRRDQENSPQIIRHNGDVDVRWQEIVLA